MVKKTILLAAIIVLLISVGVAVANPEECELPGNCSSEEAPTPTPIDSPSYIAIDIEGHTIMIRERSVTQIEFNTFLEEGYQDNQFWTAEGINWRTEQAPPEFENKDEVAYVVWYEADAFCRSEGGRLPSENEWRSAQELFEGRFDGLVEWTGSQFEVGMSPTTYTILQIQDGGIERIESRPDNVFQAAGFRCVLLSS